MMEPSSSSSVSSSDPARLLLPVQSQHALEDFFQNALLRGKEDSKESSSSSSPLLLLETVGKKFLKDVVVRAVANANNTNASSPPSSSSEDETSNVGSGVVRALRLVAKKIEEEIVGRSNADVVLLNCVHRSLHVAKEEISLLATNTRNDGCSISTNSKEQTKVYKQNVISGIREMITQDIDHARRSVGEFALELCGSDCVVCVLGVRDGLVETFLKNVARKRRVKVIVLETSVSYEENGRAMAEEFARKILNVSSSSSGGGGGRGSTSNNKDINNNNNNNSSVEVMIVPESNAFAVMSRAHLTVVSAQLGVFEDGSFYGPPGTANIARACEKFKVPLVALAPSLSLTTAEKPRMNNDDTSSSSSSSNSSNSTATTTTTTTKTTATTSLLSQERNGNPAEVLKHFRATTTTGGGGGSAARDVDAVLHPVREFIDNKNGQQKGGGEDKGFFVVEAFVTDHGVVAPANLKQLTRELYA
jgi:translation initiation factor 2B subunit (eIF-2B alpha/beta/delta family)